MIAMHKEKPVTAQDLGLWEGDIVTLLPEVDKPALKWKGAPLPQKFFDQMLGFFRHAHATWKSEATLRLAYNPTTSAWHMFCLPQIVRPGLEALEIKTPTEEQKALRNSALSILENGFMENGTTHSHCDAGAFQSGTDYAGEIKNTGVHITLGEINSDRPSVHGRVVLRGVQYKINWAEWFEGWPEELDGATDTFDLIPGTDLSFPDEWLKCCFEPPPVVKPAYGGYDYDYNYYGSKYNNPLTSTWWDKKTTVSKVSSYNYDSAFDDDVFGFDYQDREGDFGRFNVDLSTTRGTEEFYLWALDELGLQADLVGVLESMIPKDLASKIAEEHVKYGGSDTLYHLNREYFEPIADAIEAMYRIEDNLPVDTLKEVERLILAPWLEHPEESTIIPLDA